MIQVREQYGNLYVRILDTQETFEHTLEKIRYIDGRSFNQLTGEWMFGKESIGDLLRHFNNQIIWNQPLKEILKGCEVEDDLVKKHLSWENDDDFKSWNLKPYPYQKVGAHFLADRGRAAIFDGVGLGKTCQIIGAAQILINRGKAERVLIVTLNSLKRQWAKEIEKFSGEPAIAVYGPPAKRKKLIKGFASRRDVRYLVVNYETLRNKQYMDEIKKISFQVVALDEAQKIKSGVSDKYLGIKPSQNAAACYELDYIPYRFIATATPVQSKAEEIWSLFNFVDPNILGSWEIFRERFCKYHPRYGITGSQNLGELYYRIAPHFIRRTKEMPEIQQQLPAVTHSHVFLEMTEAQEKLQESLLNKIEDLKGESRKISGSKVVNGQLLSPEQLREYYDSVIQGLQTFLVETCDTPELLSHEEASNMSKSIISELGLSEKDIKKSPKLDQLKDFAKQIMNDEPSSKIVIFTEYERMARMIYNQLPHAVLYTGQISDREKENAVQRFREDPNTKIFISTRAGSTGLNLQVANYMIHFDLPYTATEIEQRNGRIDRTGNKFNNITMYYYVMSGSFEEHLIEMLHKKSLLANTILTGQSEKISNRSQDFSKIAFEKLAKKRLKSLQPA
ncbi:RNA polymerase-associated protein RapA (plasmid) [Bacillus licheniformis]|uniref:DEAD/DEAH box helicase n=1 Tax=Bacillus licheniformis TaxID=1402 RepID=UPI0009B7349D|nr:DEAD/DEAH box helicase [Bacillus licheniformis]ARC67243.1 RNA polymerase-associated protein RapA [Bacillus licheniformis]MDE1421900.1 DEAD/DEAH box helicase [Bacillus licheniformis]MEC0475905.1 DEAD/DEAH box helicase [Bacillus licheniformis]QAS18767.1 DEAD/DEAH box helicase [Bacillus licheniformis]RHL11966.1 DEAD/DEAH box helicase [Bacillus licheniformis]